MDLKQIIDRNSNIDNTYCRGATIFIVQSEWELHFRERIGDLIESIKPYLKANSAKMLEESYDVLKAQIRILIQDKDYLVKENATVFHSSLMGLEDSMRCLLNTYINEKNLYHIVLFCLINASKRWYKLWARPFSVFLSVFAVTVSFSPIAYCYLLRINKALIVSILDNDY